MKDVLSFLNENIIPFLFILSLIAFLSLVVFLLFRLLGLSKNLLSINKKVSHLNNQLEISKYKQEIIKENLDNNLVKYGKILLPALFFIRAKRKKDLPMLTAMKLYILNKAFNR